LLSLLLLKWLLGLPGPVKRRVIAAAGIFLLGAMAMEMVQGYLTTTFETAYVLRRIVTVLEEFLEMAGLIIFIGALLLFAGSSFLEVLEVCFGDGGNRFSGRGGEEAARARDLPRAS